MRCELRGLIRTGIEAQLAGSGRHVGPRTGERRELGPATIDMDQLADDVAAGLEELRLACSTEVGGGPFT